MESNLRTLVCSVMIASFIVAKWYAAINISALGWVKIEIPHEEKGGGGAKNVCNGAQTIH